MIEQQFIPFPSAKKQSPAQLFTEMEEVPRNALYICAPVTTKIGLRRDYDSILRVKKANLGHVKVHLLNLVRSGLLPDVPLLVPGLIGEREGWDEQDYNAFLFMHWLGVKKEDAEKFIQGVSLSVDQRRRMSAYSISPEERSAFYTLFQQNVVVNAHVFGTQALELLGLPRREVSLGCTLETNIANDLNISAKYVDIQSGVYRVVTRN